MPNLGAPELIIIAIVLLVLFGGAKLAGLGKSTGRALREFKEETKDLRAGDKDEDGKDKGEAPSDAAPSDAEAARKDDEPRELTQGRSETDETESRHSEESRRNP